MLDECLRIFKQELKDNTNLVLNTIILADGDYVLVHDDGTYDVEKIKYSKIPVFRLSSHALTHFGSLLLL